MRAWALALALVACRNPTPLGLAEPPGDLQRLVTFVGETGGVSVEVEIARDEATQTRGLMHRERLAPYAGMLFIYPTDREHPFWMKNTLIPLDMIFVNSDQVVVGIIENAEPLTEQSRTVGVPSRYVIEVNGGFARTHDIAPGTRVRFEEVDGYVSF